MIRRASTAPTAELTAAFRAHERQLWGVCYRMTGCAADADDLVQDTFARALERPPARLDVPLGPWLVRVAINLARDLLRRRRRRGYVGPWLPSPLETGDDEPPAHEPVVRGDDGRPLTTEGRYDLLESVSFAFLLALEALTPRQRAVLLLRDVFDYSVRQTAHALDMGEDAVKVTHHRARRAMRDYDRARHPLTRELRARTRDALERFVTALVTHDRLAAEALLAEDVRQLSDGGGEFLAARVPVTGRERVAMLGLNLVARHPLREMQARGTVLNGLPAFVLDGIPARSRSAPRVVLACELNADGRIARLYSVLASRKLTALAPAP